ncbi:hypothetical protein [Burkholderia sp. Bp8963]|uniref:hypothetical protein n=1 Tax=Burkholderia sp. Bp8963 TaxID=2184547 RepID=UPI000F592E46|nr:hypothetical protein [Burkholderia sp. Bp8963]
MRYMVETFFDSSQQRRALNRLLAARRKAAPLLRFLATRGAWRIGTIPRRFRTETTLRAERYITLAIARAAFCSLRCRVLAHSLLTTFAQIQAAWP